MHATTLLQSLLANFTRLRKKFAMKLTYIVDACNNFIAFFFLVACNLVKDAPPRQPLKVLAEGIV